jgi:uncharacterized membrane protein
MTQHSTTQPPTLKDIQLRHEELVYQNVENNDIDISQVRTFLSTIAQVGISTEKAEERYLLRDLIRYWSSVSYEKTGEYPFVELLPYDSNIARSKAVQRLSFFPQKISEPSPSLLSRPNRQRMIERVRLFWIDGVFEQSLHYAPLITLGLYAYSSYVENPWKSIVREAELPERPLPPDTQITQAYDDAGGSLLILGEPGSGKTILLLELARDLLKRAELDENHSLPVVFNLSSWTMKRQSISDWLVDELKSKYQVPHNLGKSWVDADQILPLLDGLDEVALEHRVACIDAINTYQQQHGLVPIVVCCRSADYNVLETRLILNSAIVIQPLTTQQVDEYLRSAGKQLGKLHLMLSNYPTLRELVRTPLMLSVLTLAYREQPISNLVAADSPMVLEQQVLVAYVQRMLERRGAKTAYTPQQTLHWLTWLAKQLMQHNRAVFYIEEMQQDWLPNTRLQRLYQLIVRLIVGLIAGLIVGLVSALVSGLIPGLLSGLIVGLGSEIDSKSKSVRPTEVLAWSLRRIQWSLIIALIGALLTGLINTRLNEQIGALFNGEIGTLITTLFSSLVSILISFLMLRVGSGWSTGMLDAQLRTVPNQGIRHSLRNGIFVGVVNGLSFGLISGIGFGLSTGLFYGLGFGLLSGIDFGWFLGLVNGLYSGLRYGGIAFIQHITLRLLLWHDGAIPLNYPRFLDYAAERIFLRKVGGGYIFIHRILLDYFASLDTSPSSGERM